MSKTNGMTSRVPEELTERIENTASLKGVSINQLALSAFARELSELENSLDFKNRLKGKTREELIKRFDEVMAKVPDSR